VLTVLLAALCSFVCRKDGAFEASLNAVHGLINVHSENSHRQRHENDPKGGDSFVVNGNNTLLWEVGHPLESLC
jgi:hypothetical protein